MTVESRPVNSLRTAENSACFPLSVGNRPAEAHFFPYSQSEKRIAAICDPRSKLEQAKVLLVSFMGTGVTSFIEQSKVHIYHAAGIEALCKKFESADIPVAVAYLANWPSSFTKEGQTILQSHHHSALSPHSYAEKAEVMETLLDRVSSQASQAEQIFVFAHSTGGGVATRNAPELLNVDNRIRIITEGASSLADRPEITSYYPLARMGLLAHFQAGVSKLPDRLLARIITGEYGACPQFMLPATRMSNPWDVQADVVAEANMANVPVPWAEIDPRRFKMVFTEFDMAKLVDVEKLKGQLANSDLAKNISTLPIASHLGALVNPQLWAESMYKLTAQSCLTGGFGNVY